MGTPEFAIPSLNILKQSKHKIVCVYTQPPKKKSRGQKILKTAVHVFSEKEGIIPALETAHALAFALKAAKKMKKSQSIIVNLSGRGDKDLQSVRDFLDKGKK